MSSNAYRQSVVDRLAPRKSDGDRHTAADTASTPTASPASEPWCKTQRDPACIVDGTCSLAWWNAHIDDTLAGFAASYTIVSHLRSVWSDDGQAVLVRGVMPEPAEESIAVASFEQSFHAEAFVPRPGDRTLHLYGVWNHGTLAGVSDDVPLWANQYLDGLLQWEGWLGDACAP